MRLICILMFCVAIVLGSATTARADSRSHNAPPVFLTFYDWFVFPNTWDEGDFVDPPDWTAVGVTGTDRRSEDFYDKQFRYIRSLGIDALAWEFHPILGKEPTYPSPSALAALPRNGLRIAPIYDLEISFKVKNQEVGTPTLSNPNAIHADADTAQFMVSELKQFFAHVPRELLARDKHGRLVIFVFGYGFDDSNPDPSRWSKFADDLVTQVQAFAGAAPTFYWTAANSFLADHLFSHHRDHFVPFQFVLDTPQSPFGHDAVTWNFGWDNLGVLHKYNLRRAIRLDPRYVQEMGWLAGATDPSLVFIYGWNEPFEGSLLLPTKHWGDTKARLAKEFIERLESGRDKPLPRTLIVIDDLDELWTTRRDDWHLKILSELLLYPMRRFAPQADLRMLPEVEEHQLNGYEIIIDLTSQKTPRWVHLLLAAMPSHRVMVFDPLRENGGELSAPFAAGAVERIALNREIDLIGSDHKLFARDDVYRVVPCKTCGVKLSANLGARTRPSAFQRFKETLSQLFYGRSHGVNSPVVTDAVPLVITRGDDVFVNAYPGNEDVLRAAFEALYDEPMRKSILYGEGPATQRLEFDPATQKVTYNRLSRYSVNGHWAIPDDIDWFKPPAEVGEEHFRFVFGLDE